MWKKLIKLAFEEDFGELGDVTGEAIFSDETDEFVLVSKDEGILCGIEVFEKVFTMLDADCKIEKNFQDGDKIGQGDVIAKVMGKVSSILKAERTAINFISHLSGIATKTNQFVQRTQGKTKILDTRKTLPGYRELAKYAVQCGGGENHRMGLYDMVMIKDNHADAAGNITSAVIKIRETWRSKFKIEVETRNLDEVREALDCGVDRIMLDNMDTKTMKEAVQMIEGRAEVEASGNMTLDRISEVSQTGVDYISVGELTHSVKAFDFSLKKLREVK